MQWNNRFYTHFVSPENKVLTAQKPQSFTQYRLANFSHVCADSLGITETTLSWGDIMAGQHIPAAAAPCATVYSGHQFGQWAGQLGDGRALLLGEIQTRKGSFELQLKGAGATPYSRRGDGMAVLRSSVRELLCSEAMAGLGIPTTRALGMIATNTPVIRETVETAAVVLRTASSFIRFGHFEHFAAKGDTVALQKLVDFVVQNYFPEAQKISTAPFQATIDLLAAVSSRTAKLMAHWQSVGFCHGVMNTDNMSILGLTLDYGPFGFMDTFDAAHICNHTDEQGRYAYYAQPQVGQWNIACLAQALAALIPADLDEEASEACVQGLRDVVGNYSAEFTAQHTMLFAAKLGLAQITPQFLDNTLKMLHDSRADFTRFWRQLSLGLQAQEMQDREKQDREMQDQKHHITLQQLTAARDECVNTAAFDAWSVGYLAQLNDAAQCDATTRKAMIKAMMMTNPAVVLRNHLAQTAIERAQAGDDSETQRLLAVLANPFDVALDDTPDAAAPPAWANHLAVSCSS